MRVGRPGRPAVLLGLELAQGALGYAQYALGVPPIPVLFHLLGAALVWWAAWRLAMAVRPAHPDPAPDDSTTDGSTVADDAATRDETTRDETTRDETTEAATTEAATTEGAATGATDSRGNGGSAGRGETRLPADPGLSAAGAEPRA